MKKTKKVFLPKWQRYFIIPFLLIVWVVASFQEFSKPAAEQDMAAISIMSFVFLGVSVMLWFMTSGKLPAYIIEEDSTDSEKENTEQG